MTVARSVAVFTSREDAATLARTLEAVAAASASCPTMIDVLVDGNPDTAEAIGRWRPSLRAGSTMRLWSVPWRDKACTWNRYLHEIAPQAPVAFFVDGYVRPKRDSLDAISRALDAKPAAWAATGVPTVGPSAARVRAALLSEGGIHGNLYALRGETLALLKRRGFRLPLGLYRNDSLIGAVMAFAADPGRYVWDRGRIAVVEEATWDVDVAPALSISTLRGFLRRRMRQAQGDLENAAVRQHLATRQLPPESLPRTSRELVAGGPGMLSTVRGPLARMLSRRAAQRMAEPADWSRCEKPSQLLQVWAGT